MRITINEIDSPLSPPVISFTSEIGNGTGIHRNIEMDLKVGYNYCIEIDFEDFFVYDINLYIIETSECLIKTIDNIVYFHGVVEDVEYSDEFDCLYASLRLSTTLIGIHITGIDIKPGTFVELRVNSSDVMIYTIDYGGVA